jgi:hypothetical protein
LLVRFSATVSGLGVGRRVVGAVVLSGVLLAWTDGARSEPASPAKPRTSVAPKPRPVPAQEADALRPPLLRAISAVEAYPAESQPIVDFSRTAPRRVTIGRTTAIVIPTHIRFPGLSNEYCRLAIARSREQVSLVPSPPPADPDSCRRVRELAEVDLNDDGVVDFAFLIDFRSNRYPATVTEARVYLSDLAHETYCYAALASRSLDPSADHDESRVLRRIRSEVARVGPRVLECTARPGEGPSDP